MLFSANTSLFRWSAGLFILAARRSRKWKWFVWWRPALTSLSMQFFRGREQEKLAFPPFRRWSFLLASFYNKNSQGLICIKNCTFVPQWIDEGRPFAAAVFQPFFMQLPVQCSTINFAKRYCIEAEARCTDLLTKVGLAKSPGDVYESSS